MNLIEKIVIKDGVNVDTTVNINLYTGQVSEINALLAHPSIPNTRGVAAYAIVGNKPTFSFSAVGANEMWIQVDGISIKCGGITTIDVDQSIKLVPYHVSGVYTMPNSDKNKILVVTDDSSISEINVNNLEEEESVCIQNDRSVTITVIKLIGGSENYIDILPYEAAYFRNVSEDLEVNTYIKKISNNRLLIKPDTGVTNLTLSNTISKTSDDVTIVLKSLNPVNVAITSWNQIGREIKIANMGDNFATFAVPSGHSCYYGTFPATIPSGKFITLFLIETNKWAFYQS